MTDIRIIFLLGRSYRFPLLARRPGGGAAITDVQHLLGHSSVKTTERAYAAFVRNERFIKQTIDLLDEQKKPELTAVKGTVKLSWLTLASVMRSADGIHISPAITHFIWWLSDPTK